MLITSSAWAEWEFITLLEDGSRLYIDPKTIRKNGNNRYIWEIFNLLERKNDGAISIRVRKEYDCRQERYRILSFTTHSGAMASGETIVRYSPNDSAGWDDIPPESAGEKVLRYVCAK